jgi:hypothetical protein
VNKAIVYCSRKCDLKQVALSLFTDYPQDFVPVVLESDKLALLYKCCFINHRNGWYTVERKMAREGETVINVINGNYFCQSVPDQHIPEHLPVFNNYYLPSIII